MGINLFIELRKSPQGRQIDALLGALLLFCVACQSTPPPSPPPPERQAEPEIAQTPQPEVPVAITVTPESKTEPVVTAAPKPAISRLLPESIIAAPEKDPASRQLAYNTILNGRPPAAPNHVGWQYRRTPSGQIVGFEFSNHGGNRILPLRRDPSKNQFFSRDFQFRFDERARQDIYLLVTDWVAARDRQFRLSELMNSVMHFFPRSLLPAIVTFGGRNLVTLPTGEEVEFDAMTSEILAGPLVESPVDLNPDRALRKFPAVHYNGKGIVVRANARGADPRIGTTATVMSGSPAPGCDKGIKCNQCQIPSRDLWDQSGALRFKYATDQEFDRFLFARCRFGLPIMQSENTGVAPAK